MVSFNVVFVVAPACASDFAVGVGTVEAEKEDGLFECFFGFERDGELLVVIGGVGGGEGGKGFVGVGGKDEVVNAGLAECAVVLFVEYAKTEGADVTCSVIAWGDRGQLDGIGTDEANVCFGGQLVVVVVLLSISGIWLDWSSFIVSGGSSDRCRWLLIRKRCLLLMLLLRLPLL